MSRYTLGPRGESLIKSFETLVLKAYLPTVDDVPTIGFGHTRGVRMGDIITRAEAEKFFWEDVASSVTAVNKLPCKLTQSMFDALVSLVFNVGPGCIKAGSTIGNALRAQVPPSIGNDGYYRAWAGFALWRKQGPKDLLGLARRRAQEMSLFLDDGMPR